MILKGVLKFRADVTVDISGPTKGTNFLLFKLNFTSSSGFRFSWGGAKPRGGVQSLPKSMKMKFNNFVIKNNLTFACEKKKKSQYLFLSYLQQ